MERWEIPSDWTEEDGYTTVLFCIPNSQKWRGLIVGMVESLAFGWSWDEQTGVVKDVQAIGREIFESMSMCKLDVALGNLAASVDRLTAAIAGEAAPVANPEDTPAYDYTQNGVVPTAISLFKTSGLFGILPDMSIADSVNAGLIGRQLLELPIPGQGDGLADIFDEQTTLLNQIASLIESHLVMQDSSIWNIPGGQKNLVEVLETTLRTTSYSDLEPFPNVADILQSSLKLEDDAFWSNLWRALGLKEPLPDKNSVAQILAGILALMGRDTSALRGIAQAILANPVKINVNNLNNCDGKPLNGNGKGESIVTTITDEGVKVEQIEAPSNPLLGGGN